MKFFNIEMKKDEIEGLLDWHKLLIGINSTSLVALLFKSSVNIQDNYSLYTAIVALNLSLIMLLLAYVGIILQANKNSKNRLDKLTSFLMVFGWLSFIVGFTSISISILPVEQFFKSVF